MYWRYRQNLTFDWAKGLSLSQLHALPHWTNWCSDFSQNAGLLSQSCVHEIYYSKKKWSGCGFQINCKTVFIFFFFFYFYFSNSFLPKQYNCAHSTALLRLEIYAAPLGNTPPRQSCDTAAPALCKGQFPCSWSWRGEFSLCSSFFQFCCGAEGRFFRLSMPTMWWVSPCPLLYLMFSGRKVR